jgi:long-chain acyl-CoA synthetase
MTEELSATTGGDEAGPGGPVPATLPEVFRAIAGSHPHSTLTNIEGQDLSYRDGLTAARRLARLLQDEGIGKGDRVLVCLPNDADAAIVCMAIWLAGAVVVTGSVLDPLATLAFKVRDSGARLVVGGGDEAVMAKLAEAGGGAAPVRRASQLVAGVIGEANSRLVPAEEDECSPESLALLQYTGGTTGDPKAAMLTHANLVVNGRQLREALGNLRPGAERFLLAAPLSHITGMSTMLLGLSLAAELVFVARFQAQQVARLIAERGITYLIGVPTMYNAMLQPGLSAREDWKTVRFALVGGAPVTSTLADGFAAATGMKLLCGYGLSETAPAVTVMRPGAPGAAGSAGQAVADTVIEIRSLDDPERTCAPGDPGEICVAGPQVTQGYWGKPDATRAAFVDGLFRTGDIGFVDEDGHLHVVDRLKDMIIASGFNVYPAHVEGSDREVPQGPGGRCHRRTRSLQGRDCEGCDRSPRRRDVVARGAAGVPQGCTLAGRDAEAAQPPARVAEVRGRQGPAPSGSRSDGMNASSSNLGKGHRCRTSRSS